MIDYIVLEAHGDFSVWTPDESGACLGSGKTKAKALEHAVRNAEEFIDSVLDGRHRSRLEKSKFNRGGTHPLDPSP